ncbi:TetR/AcrR family transcriptional regulator [Nocardia terpenica]|uniref:TetR family transcriptional regulator n=1 Tax=Nocardia terpenica TaxID=455432 RepID=A0A6G9Z0E3_9NOCA|nr:TetR/AcrR family transcriptional regulator [Nocardia terpenica]QIS18932.1 TetR family transcriptional regulator [Nocardia terpenica]
MSSSGLRESKKARTRQHIADVAARLFAEHGYESTSIATVAREAAVSEQTVYNYFPTKQQLVLDRDEEIRASLSELVRNRAPGVSPARAIRGEMLAIAESIRSIPPDQLHGTIGYIAAGSPTVHRLALEATDRLADAIAEALTVTTPGLDPAVAKVQGIALAWVSQTIIDESGRRSRRGQTSHQIADELLPLLEAILDDLERWPDHPQPR